MALRFSTSTKNGIVNAVITGLAGTTGTAGTGFLSLYSGTQPTTGDTGTNGTLLATIINISWALCTGGTSALTNTFTGTSSTSGTIGWGRFEAISASGTFRMDGNVGTGATNVFVVNTVSFSTAGGLVSLLSGPIYMA